MEGLPGVSEARIEAHEEVAAAAAVGAGILGALALGALVLAWGKPLRPVLSALVLTVALGVAGAITYTAKLGGEIRHTEIAGAAAVAGGGAEGDVERVSGHMDDD